MSRIISFIFTLCYVIGAFFGVSPSGYAEKELLADSDFSDGFYVLSQDRNGSENIKLGTFAGTGENTPSWMIAQWTSGPCLWNDRAESDDNVLSDGKVKTVIVDSESHTVSLKLNGAGFYNNAAAGLDNFPHLLLEQAPFVIKDEAGEFYSCGSDRLVFSMSLRMSDYVKTTNPDGINAVQFLTYFYVMGKDTDDFVWFGMDLFDDRGLNDTYWERDTVGSTNMIYSLSTRETYGSALRSIYKKGVSDKWTRIVVDLTPHLDRLIKKLNAENVFGRTVTRDDFYIGGMNVGFEMHGNASCTFDIREMSLKSYRSNNFC